MNKRQDFKNNFKLVPIVSLALLCVAAVLVTAELWPAGCLLAGGSLISFLFAPFIADYMT